LVLLAAVVEFGGHVFVGAECSAAFEFDAHVKLLEDAAGAVDDGERDSGVVCDELPGCGDPASGGRIRESGVGCGDGDQAFDADAVCGECGLAGGGVGDVVAELAEPFGAAGPYGDGGFASWRGGEGEGLAALPGVVVVLVEQVDGLGGGVDGGFPGVDFYRLRNARIDVRR
jgi:hypothetical protein